MHLTLIILGTFLGVSIFFSAIGKIKRIPGAVEAIAHVGVKESQYNQLAALEILGALGLLVGVWIKPIGIAAALGIVLYFVGAITAHAKKKDSIAQIFPALFLFVISAVVFYLQLQR